MKVKVAHLFRKIEEIDRDLTELAKLKDRISSDRDYSDFMKSAFQEEIAKLEQEKQDILALPVQNAPTNHAKTKKQPSPIEMKNLYETNESEVNSEITVEIANRKPANAKKNNFKY